MKSTVLLKVLHMVMAVYSTGRCHPKPAHAALHATPHLPSWSPHRWDKRQFKRVLSRATPYPSQQTQAPGFPARLRARGGGRTAPHRGDSGFPEKTESILKTGSGVGKAELLGQRIRLRTKWQPTPVFLPRESSGQRSLSMGSHRVGHD